MRLEYPCQGSIDDSYISFQDRRGRLVRVVMMMMRLGLPNLDFDFCPLINCSTVPYPYSYYRTMHSPFRGTKYSTALLTQSII